MATQVDKSHGVSSARLIEFLLARISDDEAELRRAAKHRDVAGMQSDFPSKFPAGAQSVDRLRADFASKRQLIGVLQQLIIFHDQPNESAVRSSAAKALKLLARPYAGHQTYQVEWRP